MLLCEKLEVWTQAVGWERGGELSLFTTILLSVFFWKPMASLGLYLQFFYLCLSQHMTWPLPLCVSKPPCSGKDNSLCIRTSPNSGLMISGKTLLLLSQVLGVRALIHTLGWDTVKCAPELNSRFEQEEDRTSKFEGRKIEIQSDWQQVKKNKNGGWMNRAPKTCVILSSILTH